MIQSTGINLKDLRALVKYWSHFAEPIHSYSRLFGHCNISLTVFVSSIKKLYKINKFSLAAPSSQSNTDWLFSWELFLIPKTQHWFEREGEGRKIFKDVFLRRNRVMHIVGLKNYQLLHENSSKTSCVSIEWKMKEKARSPAWIPAWFYIFFNQIFA